MFVGVNNLFMPMHQYIKIIVGMDGDGYPSTVYFLVVQTLQEVINNETNGLPCWRVLTRAFLIRTWDSGISMLETYYSNFIARQLNAQKCLKYKKSQYWTPVGSGGSLLPFWSFCVLSQSLMFSRWGYWRLTNEQSWYPWLNVYVTNIF